MTREEIILKHIKRNGRGLEIGPGCAPIAPKKRGFRVHVLDHCDKNALIEKYRPHGINLENIEEVDFVWDGRPYVELIGRRHVYDWIIGSHVLEHTTDLIGFLNDCDSLLKKDGVLSLAVPDKRYIRRKFIRPERWPNIFSPWSAEPGVLPGRRAKKASSSWCIHWRKRNKRSAVSASLGIISMSTNGVSPQLRFD